MAIALRDDAIRVDDRPTGAEPFFTTNLKDPMKATRVHWKPSKLKVPIFRQAVRTANGFQTSEHKALRYSTYAYYLDRLGWEAGLEQKLTSYCARRCTGNAVDGKCIPLSILLLLMRFIRGRHDGCSQPDHETRTELGHFRGISQYPGSI
jgi:hypothetical protein